MFMDVIIIIIIVFIIAFPLSQKIKKEKENTNFLLMVWGRVWSAKSIPRGTILNQFEASSAHDDMFLFYYWMFRLYLQLILLTKL